MKRRAVRLQPARLVAGAIAAATLAVGGCMGMDPDSRTFAIDATPYSGPSMDVLAADGVHTVRVQSPTPGWDIGLDGTERTADERRVFLTLRRPDPQYLYPAVMVEQRVRTSVGSDETIAVYARVLEFVQDDDAGYHRVSPEP